MALSPEQFHFFDAVDEDTPDGPKEIAEKPPNEAVDLAYWMNGSNPGHHYRVRH